MAGYLPRLIAAFFILACTVGAACAAAPRHALEYAGDLAALGARAAATGTPIMLVFTRPGCPYCARAKKDHLEPLSVSPQYGAKVIVREVEATSDTLALTGFDGRTATHRSFARGYHVRVVPTVLVVDGRGAPLGEPIVGLNSTDFYNLYLEQAIDAARAALAARNP